MKEAQRTNVMPADPVSAGRKGGQSRSTAKLAAARRNGFQRSAPHSIADRCLPQRPAVLVPAQPTEAK
jgi:hypothetical protein